MNLETNNLLEFDSKQKEALQFYYTQFKNWQDDKGVGKDRDQRKKTIQYLLSPGKIDTLTEEEIDKFEAALFATQVRFQKSTGITKENDLHKIRKTLKYLVYGDDDPLIRAQNVKENDEYKLKGFGESKISETLSRTGSKLFLVNERVVNLAERLGVKIIYDKDSYPQKIQTYNEFIQNIQKLLVIDDMDKVDFLIYFIDSIQSHMPRIEEPLPRFEKGQFMFSAADFNATTGKKADAKYLHNRFKILEESLKIKLGDKFSHFQSYVNKANKRPQPGKDLKYYRAAWIGFSAKEFTLKRIQESIQLQVTLHENDVDAYIWISYVGKEAIKNVLTTIEKNPQQFLNTLQELPSDFTIGAYIVDKPEKDLDYPLSEFDNNGLHRILQTLSEKDAELGVGYTWKKDDVLSKGPTILNEISDTFVKLLPSYYFLNGTQMKTQDKIDTTSLDESNEYEKILVSKKQLIFYGPPGTGKTFQAKNFAEKFTEKNIRNRIGDEPMTSNKNDWFEYLKNKLLEIAPSDYEIDHSEGEEYFALKSKNDEKRIRVFYGNKERTEDSVEVGFKEKPISWLEQVPKENRFFIIINLSNSSYTVIPFDVIKDNAQFRGGEHWDSSGDNSMWFTMSTLKEDMAILRSKHSLKENRYDCRKFLFNPDRIFISDIEYVTFHPSYSYEEFIEGIRARTNNISQLEYYIEDGIFKRICRAASNDKNENNRYVLIIDEINRGNISKIFGELITIIEKDKRDQIPVTLAYSKTRFTVPKNIFIVGTMNTADRSLVQIDLALRRRFGFVEIMPQPSLLKNIEGISLKSLLENLNTLILEHTDNREQQIGHSYFMRDGESITTLSDLQFVFETEIIPLLQEYFYQDYNEIAKVLGPDFVNTGRQEINKLTNEQFRTALNYILNHGKNN